MKKRQILIEFTPLLDVILILLFVIMAQSRLTADAAVKDSELMESKLQIAEERNEKTDGILQSLRKENAELRDELEGLVTEQDADNAVLQNSCLLKVRVSADGTVHFTYEGTEVASLKYVWGKEGDFRERVASVVLQEFRSNHKMSNFIVFSYDSKRILNREYEAIVSGLVSGRQEAEKEHIEMNIIYSDTQE